MWHTRYKSVFDQKAGEADMEECTCIVCGNKQTEGLHIVSQFICKHCEAEIVQTDVKDDKYSFFVHRLRQIWIQKNA